MTEIFNISTLERESGVARSTIHFYIRRGLLPPPQKTAASRSLYGESHLALLRKIMEMKETGSSLAEIRATLGPALQKAAENKQDLAEQERDRVRREILRVATEEFETNGYEKTHVSTITKKLGITQQVLYSHFASKLELLVECFRTFMSWNVAYHEARIAESSDLGERVLWRLFADYRARELDSDVTSHIHAEQGHSAAERVRLAERAWELVARVAQLELESLREPGRSPQSIPLELLSYSLVGAHRTVAMKASWNEEWTQEDVLRTHLWLWLAVAGALSGAIDIDSQLAPYEDLIREIAKREPETPPTPGR